MEKKVWALVSYGNGDSTRGSVTLFSNESKAYRAWEQAVIDDLSPTFVDWNLSDGHRYDDSIQKVKDYLRKVEMKNFYDDSDGDRSCYYNPHKMSYDYSDRDNDYFSCIKVEHKEIL